MNPRLPVWVQASISIFLQAIAPEVKFFVEGVDDETPEAFQQNSVLVRINGPTIRYLDTYSIQVQVVLTDLMQSGYEHFERCGKFVAALDSSIPIYRHGDGGELLACLSSDRGSRDRVSCLHFGQVDPAMKIRQSAVSANFELSL